MKLVMWTNKARATSSSSEDQCRALRGMEDTMQILSDEILHVEDESYHRMRRALQHTSVYQCLKM